MPIQISGAGATLTPIPAPAGVADFVRKIRAPAMWHRGITGSGVKVAIIDTGVDLVHPFLKDEIGATQSFVPGQGVQDAEGHGTHVAGIIHQVAPGATLIVAKGLSDAGDGEEASLAAAIRWCVAQGARVINASWGSAEEPAESTGLHTAIREAVAAGVLFISSAGNNRPVRVELDTVGYPARWPEPLAVAATWQLVAGANYAVAAPYSSAGPEVDVAAPGTFIRSCAPGGGWVDMSGTSMAAPVVAGLAALLIQDLTAKHMDATEPALVTLLEFLTRDLPGAGRNVAGVGEVDLVPLAERRRVTLTDGGTKIAVQNTGTLADSTLPLDVPARIEDGRFLAPFRQTAEACGASDIRWDPGLHQGAAEIDVLPMGTPDSGDVPK